MNLINSHICLSPRKHGNKLFFTIINYFMQYCKAE